MTRNSGTYALVLIVVMAVAAIAAGEATAQPAPAPAARAHLVFAHYMTCFFSSVEFYKQEIELAQRHGIDGFALNCGQWFVRGKPGNYVHAAERIYQAAKELGTDFKLMFSPDHNPEAMMDMVKRFYKHPNQFRYNGKAVLSGYGGPVQIYADPIRKIREAGFDVLYVPNVGVPRFKMAWSYESVLALFEGQPHMDGVFRFAADGTANDLMSTNATCRRVTQRLGKIYMAGLAPAYNSPNLRDFQGMHGYGAMWEGIIRDDADWVEIVTWNDYNEDSNLMPYRWKDGWQRQYYDHDEAYLDVTAYYSAWYKSGRRPAITQDKLYYAYRSRSHWLRRAWDAQQGKWVDLTMTKWPFDQIHDDAQNYVYATTFLTAPAKLTIRIGKVTRTFAMPAGIGHAKVPLRAGVPQFTLARPDKALLDVIGRKRILDAKTINKTNSTKGYHLLNRTWTGAAAVGPVTTIEAESGQNHGGAKVTKDGIETTESANSGFTVRLRGLRTGTYNVRVVYRNPGVEEARLTMMADGPPRAERDYPYYIPLPLPPTKPGRSATVSFFWSLYDTTTWLKIAWQPGVGYSKSDKAHPLYDDQGSVLIDRVELVAVEPVRMPKRRSQPWPEMVAIPGGSFTMGAADGKPDEAPAHKVTLSPFAISRCEVTNEQFERFDPTHRKHRDGFSWRNREPVIYVSWKDGANYCNWLSEQAGLKPVYALTETVETIGTGKRQRKRTVRKWVTDMTAHGFRMPTEAEWEYVATGRGQGRKYPWGNDAPDAARGHFMGKRALAINPNVPSTAAKGTMVVGSYPAGASRDGVMDLAGNVAEWCSDWLVPYAEAAQTNPCGTTPGNYRAIRGGSWGYYGHSQRSRDREYNNPKYPGYIYVGLRVVLSEAGWKKLAGK